MCSKRGCWECRAPRSQRGAGEKARKQALGGHHVAMPRTIAPSALAHASALPARVEPVVQWLARTAPRAHAPEALVQRRPVARGCPASRRRADPVICAERGVRGRARDPSSVSGATPAPPMCSARVTTCFAACARRCVRACQMSMERRERRGAALRSRRRRARRTSRRWPAMQTTFRSASCLLVCGAGPTGDLPAGQPVGSGGGGAGAELRKPQVGWRWVTSVVGLSGVPAALPASCYVQKLRCRVVPLWGRAWPEQHTLTSACGHLTDSHRRKQVRQLARDDKAAAAQLQQQLARHRPPKAPALCRRMLTALHHSVTMILCTTRAAGQLQPRGERGPQRQAGAAVLGAQVAEDAEQHALARAQRERQRRADAVQGAQHVARRHAHLPERARARSRLAGPWHAVLSFCDGA